MAVIVIERDFAEPMGPADILGAESRHRWCMETHRVGSLLHLVARDGLRMVCVTEAPDLEAARTVVRASGLPARTIWPATFHLPAGVADAGAPSLRVPPGAALVVVERSFDAAITFDAVQAMEDAERSCFDIHRVAFLATYMAKDGHRMLCIYAAPDTESVRIANRQGGLPFDCAWAAEAIASPT